MLDLGRYLLGVADLALLVGFAWLGASGVRARLLPNFNGAPAHLASSVLALALLLLVAQLLGSFGIFEPLSYLVVVAVAGLGMRALWPAGPVAAGDPPPLPVAQASYQGAVPPTAPPAGGIASVIGLGLALVALVKFGIELKPHLSAGMTGFDSTWYHGPFAANFFQTGNTWELHYIAPQFLAWLYPANSELFHAIGMQAFDRDVLSPLLNLGWFAGCLLACWCIGRPLGVAPWSLALGAIALSVPAMADQAGEARNDIVGIFFLLAAVAIAVNAWKDEERLGAGALVVVGLAAGLAAGTKLNFLLPAGVLVLGFGFVSGRGGRAQALVVATGAALLGDGAVWSDWFLPGLHDGLWLIWPLLLIAAIGGLLLTLARGRNPALRIAGLVGLAAALAWLVAPTSASGPDGMPRGFESGLRYLAPALVLGLALLPTVLPVRLRAAAKGHPPNGRILKVPPSLGRHLSGRGMSRARAAVLIGVLALAIAIGYPVQRHYLENRYASPTFTAPGLNAAFAWARDISDARIATTSTRQYPFYGTDLSNDVQFVGIEQPHGGFVAPSTCPAWRRLLSAGDYDYVVTSHDRLGEGKTIYPLTAGWTEGPSATEILREPPTVVFKLTGPLDPSSCPS